MKAILAVIATLWVTAGVFATPQIETKRGNKLAEQSKTDEALIHYKQALEQKGDTSVILYDLGNVMYQKGEYESAEKSYLGSLDPRIPVEDQAEALYNLGNTYFQPQKFDKAAQAYVEALKRTPKDAEAKYNLELARRMLQQQKQEQQQQQQNQDQQEQKDEQKQDQQDQQQQKDQQQQEQQQQEQQNQQQQEQKEEEQQAQQPQRERQMSQEEAERLLNALLQNEQDALKQAKKVKVQAKAKREKDW